jgi:hypothetical protein
MFRCLFSFLLFCWFTSISAEHTIVPYLTSENDTLSLIDETVDVFNGKLVQIDKDIEIQGSHPFELVRYKAKSASEYVQKSSDFLLKSQQKQCPTKIDVDGTIRVFEPQTNTFASYHSNGTTKTFYNPDSSKHDYVNSIEYWNSQKGNMPWTP